MNETAPAFETPREEEQVELLVLRPKQKAIRCRNLESGQEITFRTGGAYKAVPGEILVVRPRKQWTYAGHPYLSGEITASRIDPEALGLEPLKLQEMGPFQPYEPPPDPEEENQIEDWLAELMYRGTRTAYEMEAVLPGEDPEDFDSDPILEAVDLAQADEKGEARELLFQVLEQDLRCLDAHAHLGSFVFDFLPALALKHYQVGVRIGDLSLPSDFDDYLPWGFIDNRPYLRCLHGLGLCLWRQGRLEEARAVLERNLRYNPDDNQGIRFLLPFLRKGIPWEDLPDNL